MHPRDKAKRYAAELKSRTGPDGKRLTDSQINFRIGYLRARQDAGAAYRVWKAKQHQGSFDTDEFFQAALRRSGASVPPNFITFDAEEAFRANIRRGQSKNHKK